MTVRINDVHERLNENINIPHCNTLLSSIILFFFCLCDFPFSVSFFSGKVKPLFIYLLERSLLCIFMTAFLMSIVSRSKSTFFFTFFVFWVIQTQRE